MAGTAQAMPLFLLNHIDKVHINIFFIVTTDIN